MNHEDKTAKSEREELDVHIVWMITEDLTEEYIIDI
jgi:hypothetical protein